MSWCAVKKFLRDWKMHLMSGSQALCLCVPLTLLTDSFFSIPSLCNHMTYWQIFKNVPAVSEIRYD